MRKTGFYNLRSHTNDRRMLTYRMETETDLHNKVVDYIRKRYPNSMLEATLGENQDASFKRLDSYKKGYQRGSPDLIINDYHKKYRGQVIEFKTQRGTGILSKDQEEMLRRYKLNCFLILVSDDYNEVIETITDYFKNARLQCALCARGFKNIDTLGRHTSLFHRRSIIQ